jgi:hypothetical protein
MLGATLERHRQRKREKIINGIITKPLQTACMAEKK